MAGIRRGLPTLAALAAALAIAACDTLQPGTIPEPVVTPRTNGDGEIYGGFAYPAGNGTTTLELDAPLNTENGTPYFSFTVNARVVGLRGIDPRWAAPAGPETPLERVDGPCQLSAGPVQRVLMESRARAHTGRVVPASYDQEIDAKLDAGTALYWVTCHPGAPGEVFGPGNASVDYNLAILLPKATLAAGGELRLRAVQLAGGATSPPIAIPVVPSPTYVGVAGDSVAWGQGLLEQEKFHTRLFNDIDERTGSARLRREAHSGAHLRRTDSDGGTPFIADADGCGLNRDVHGEVPRRSPTIQCQVRNLAAEHCRTDGAALGAVAVPVFYCGDDVVPDGIDPSSLVDIELDAGPRFDFVFMNGCINDIGAFAMLLGDSGLNDTATLINSINSHCNLNNSLRDLRFFLPNATIAYPGYHFIVSASSSFESTGCQVIAPPGTSLAALQADTVVAAINLYGLTASGMVERSELFRSLSRAALQTSILGIDAAGDGAGKAIFIDMDTVFLAPHATLGPSPRSFGLTCTGTGYLVPEDPMAGERVGPCSSFANPDGQTPNSVQEESCLRASAFHPNLPGNVGMFVRIRNVLTAAGRYPPP